MSASPKEGYLGHAGYLHLPGGGLSRIEKYPEGMLVDIFPGETFDCLGVLLRRVAVEFPGTVRSL